MLIDILDSFSQDRWVDRIERCQVRAGLKADKPLLYEPRQRSYKLARAIFEP